MFDKYYIGRRCSTRRYLVNHLFNVEINDIVKQVDPGVECSVWMSVDMYKSLTVDAIYRKLQHTINSLGKWFLKKRIHYFQE